MAKVLVVIARPESPKSRTLKVLNAFMDEYVKVHPNDVIEKLDLYKVDFQEIDGDIFSAWDELEAGRQFSDLTSIQQVKLAEFNTSTDQFLAADKVVIANPLINLMVPTKLKAWIDTINVAGKTFKYTDTGTAVPLTSGKKAFHIQAAGGKYNNQDFGTQYVKGILNFVGVQSVTKLSVEEWIISRIKQNKSSRMRKLSPGGWRINFNRVRKRTFSNQKLSHSGRKPSQVFGRNGLAFDCCPLSQV